MCSHNTLLQVEKQQRGDNNHNINKNKHNILNNDVESELDNGEDADRTMTKEEINKTQK